ncbi:hypothetical protein [Propionibacterium freudenreichii]|uniref:hypothetical protein n=1 Tax=Propionibacterium freudenreichii TaxID=1744 RepID=UPI0021A966D2|nr:hypothetical protein [Propionibacterium freudenreichii]MCT2991180.1 hypothetical protein [Propionibacterium freudenreichii]MCT2994474.1 hypothetical protein [Propionibacterium freudenreichii]MDK9665160.1 hypothetical protein [Propionibacterium freudenreichii]
MSQPGHEVELADDAHHSPRPRSTTGSLRRELVAIGLVAALVALIGLTPLLTNSHFYWYDDSAGGAYGQWFELGRQISHGIGHCSTRARGWRATTPWNSSGCSTRW